MFLLEKFLFEINQVVKNGAFGLSLIDIGIVISFIIFALLIRGLFAKFIVNRLRFLVKKTSNQIDDVLFDALVPPFKLLPIVLAFLTITLYFDFQSTLGIYLQKTNQTLSTIFIFWLIHQSLIPLSKIFHKLDKILSRALVLWIIRSLKYLIIFLGAVAVLEVWGIKVGPVIAGLGLFGVAVALGAQDLFKNLISGIMILLEKRFQIGDVISVPGHTEGTVEHIGFRSILIRKFDSTPITLPNYIFAEAPILNYSNRDHRRINLVIGLEYNSTLEQIKSLTSSIKEYISQNNNFIINENYKCYVRLEKFNDSSIDILVYCFTATKEWEMYLEVKEELALFIKESIEKMGLSFAFPSRSIYIENSNKIDL